MESINNNLLHRLIVPKMMIPMGISFFTFEAVSLLTDVYVKKIDGKIGIAHVYLYLTFFPTVTSGPIVRYSVFGKGLLGEFVTSEWGKSIERIIIGLCKKVLVADKIAILADYYFDGMLAEGTYSSVGLWIGSIAFTLQLYFDFSGYSDMAIGIGGMMGFHIRENFNKPYQACSISDFWKRWHISLSQWFKDYVYIPLGGNRCTMPRHILNLLIVWLLTGIWHGADWTFVLWGVGYFILLAIEKYVSFINNLESHWIGHVYTLFFVNLLWVLFRADNLEVAGKYIYGMFGGGKGVLEDKAISFLPFLFLVILLCFPCKQWVGRLEQNSWFNVFREIVIMFLAFLAICAVVNSSYVPYIYGNF